MFDEPKEPWEFEHNEAMREKDDDKSYVNLQNGWMARFVWDEYEELTDEPSNGYTTADTSDPTSEKVFDDDSEERTEGVVWQVYDEASDSFRPLSQHRESSSDWTPEVERVCKELGIKVSEDK